VRQCDCEPANHDREGTAPLFCRHQRGDGNVASDPANAVTTPPRIRNASSQPNVGATAHNALHSARIAKLATITRLRSILDTKAVANGAATANVIDDAGTSKPAVPIEIPRSWASSDISPAKGADGDINSREGEDGKGQVRPVG
jgi:hypothetical protein